MIDLYRLPSTKRWLTECLERYGIQLREPVILWLSVQGTNCSESRPRNWARSNNSLAVLPNRVFIRARQPREIGS